jgi:uncharacterized protein YneF (UPF0154 family)
MKYWIYMVAIILHIAVGFLLGYMAPVNTHDIKEETKVVKPAW